MKFMFPILRGLGVGEGDREKIKRVVLNPLESSKKVEELKKDSNKVLFSSILLITFLKKLGMNPNVNFESNPNTRRPFIQIKIINNEEKIKDSVVKVNLLKEMKESEMKLYNLKTSNSIPSFMHFPNDSHIHSVVEVRKKADGKFTITLSKFPDPLARTRNGILPNIGKVGIAKRRESTFNLLWKTGGKITKVENAREDTILKETSMGGKADFERIPQFNPKIKSIESIFRSNSTRIQIESTRNNPEIFPKDVRIPRNTHITLERTLGKILKELDEILKKNGIDELRLMKVDKKDHRNSRSRILQTSIRNQMKSKLSKFDNLIIVKRRDFKYNDVKEIRKDSSKLPEKLDEILRNGKLRTPKSGTVERTNFDDPPSGRFDGIEKFDLKEKVEEERDSPSNLRILKFPVMENEKDRTEFVNEIVKKIDKMVEKMEVKGESNSKTRISEKILLKLHPPKLGRLEITVVKEGESFEIRFKVQSEIAEKILRDHTNDLEKRLKEIGLTLSKITIERNNWYDLRDHPTNSGENEDRDGSYTGSRSWGDNRRNGNHPKRNFDEFLRGSDGNDEWS